MSLRGVQRRSNPMIPSTYKIRDCFAPLATTILGTFYEFINNGFLKKNFLCHHSIISPSVISVFFPTIPLFQHSIILSLYPFYPLQPEQAVGLHQQDNEKQRIGCHIFETTADQRVEITCEEVLQQTEYESSQKRTW